MFSREWIIYFTLYEKNKMHIEHWEPFDFKENFYFSFRSQKFLSWYLFSLSSAEIDVLYCTIQMIQLISHLRYETFHPTHWINYFNGLCVWIIAHLYRSCKTCMNPAPINERFNFTIARRWKKTCAIKCSMSYKCIRRQSGVQVKDQE